MNLFKNKHNKKGISFQPHVWLQQIKTLFFHFKSISTKHGFVMKFYNIINHCNKSLIINFKPL